MFKNKKYFKLENIFYKSKNYRPSMRGFEINFITDA